MLPGTCSESFMGNFINSHSGEFHQDNQEEREDELELEAQRPSPGKSSRTHGGSTAAPGRPGKRSLTSRLVEQVARIDRKIVPGSRLQRSAREALRGTARSRGRPLPESLRKVLEEVSRTDLSKVRVHTGPASDAASRALGARAFTAGQDIHFASGEYDPESAAGQRLIAHEVAHTLQQRALAPMDVEEAPISPEHSADERKADGFAQVFELHLRGQKDAEPGVGSAAQLLPASVRARMERAFSRDFGDVEIHTNSPRATGTTHAVTEGREVHFGAGRFQPGTPEGDWLIGHELAHVVQQTEGQDPSAPATGALEVEADRAASLAARGEPASVALHAPAGQAQAFNEADEAHALDPDEDADQETAKDEQQDENEDEDEDKDQAKDEALVTGVEGKVRADLVDAAAVEVPDGTADELLTVEHEKAAEARVEAHEAEGNAGSAAAAAEHGEPEELAQDAAQAQAAQEEAAQHAQAEPEAAEDQAAAPEASAEPAAPEAEAQAIDAELAQLVEQAGEQAAPADAQAETPAAAEQAAAAEQTATTEQTATAEPIATAEPSAANEQTTTTEPAAPQAQAMEPARASSPRPEPALAAPAVEPAPAPAARIQPPRPVQPVSVQPVSSEPREQPDPSQDVVTQPDFTINAQGQSAGSLPTVEPVTPESAAAQSGIDISRQANLAGAVMQDPSVATARTQAQTLAQSMTSEAQAAGAAAAAQTPAPPSSPAPSDSPAQTAATARLAAISAAAATSADVPALPAPAHLPTTGPGGAASGSDTAPQPTAAQAPEANIQRDAVAEVELPAPPAPTGMPAPAVTQTQDVQAPQVAPVTNPGGDSVPDPSSMVAATISLDADRSAHQAALSAEVDTKSVIPPNADAQRTGQIAPLPPYGEAVFTASTEAPHASILTAQQTGRQSTHTTAETGIQAQAQAAEANATIQRTAAQAEQELAASQPPPPVLDGAVQVAATVQASAAETASAVVMASAADPAFVAPASTSALLAQAQGMQPPAPAELPDTSTLAEQPALPPSESEQVAAQATAEAQAQVTEAQAAIQQPIPPVQIDAPSASSGGEAGSREAAIAAIESEVASQVQAQSDSAMESAAGPQRELMNQQLADAQTQAEAQVTEAQAQEQALRSEIQAEPPPVTEADVQAQAQAHWDEYQATAESETATMQASVTDAEAQAHEQQAQAIQTHEQAVTQAQTEQQAAAQQAQTEYAAQQAQAQATYEQEQQAAAQTLTEQQAQAEAQAQEQQAQAEAQTQAQVQAAEAEHDAGVAQADQQYQAEVQAAEAEHQAQVAQIQADEQTQTAQLQSDLDAEVARLEQEGQAASEQHLSQGEADYQAAIAAGQAEADAERARAEADAEAKRREAEEAKNDKNIFERAADWVSSQVSSLLNAAADILRQARDLVVSIMEQARQAALAVLEGARQLAQQALAAAKDLIQGAISAASAAIQALIDATAQLIQTAIEATAAVLKACVEQLETAINGLIEVFQTVVNAALDGLIAAVSLINEEWGQALESATAEFRQTFNAACDQLQAAVSAASDQLQAGIDQAAQILVDVVQGAAEILKDAVVLIEQGLHAAVDLAYQAASIAIDAAFAVAEAAVNTVFAIAEAVVAAWFNAQIAMLEVAAVIVEEAGKLASALIGAVVDHISAQFEALVELLPDSIIQGFIDFWNSSWREVIIIGLASIAAVAITVATLGTGAPVAAILMAAVIGGTIAGSAYFAGEMAARHGETELFERDGKIYIPGVGDVDPSQIQMDPQTGLPVRPEGMSDQQYQQLIWAASNFHIENGTATAKSNDELFDYALSEGAEGFVTGAISSAVAMGGALGGNALAGRFASDFAKIAANKAVGGVVGMFGSAGSKSATVFIETLENGGSFQQAAAQALSTGWTTITDPKAWAAALLTAGFKTGGAAAVNQRFTNQWAQSAANVSADTVAEALGTMGGPAAVEFVGSITSGEPLEQAWDKAVQAGGGALTPEGMLQILFGNIAAEAASPGATRRPTGPDPNATPTTPRPQGTDPDADGTTTAPRPQGTDPEATVTAPRPQGTDPEATVTAPRPQGTDPDATVTAPRPQGTDPEATVTAPRPQGTDPDATVTAPRPQGTDPDATVTAPRPQGTDPEATVTAPRPQGTDPDATVTAPRPQGTDPEAQGPQPRTQPGPTQEQIDSFRQVTENKLTYGGEDYEQLRIGVEQAIAKVRTTDPALADALAQIPMDELMALRGYTTQDYQAINPSLRGYVPRDDAGNDLRGIVDPSLQLPPQELAARLAPYVALAEGAMAKLPPYQGDVYRSMSIDPSKLPDLYAQYTTKGGIIEDAAFYSTSTNPNIQMAPQDNVKLIISQESGREISWLSRYQGEQEVLFPPGTRFRVLEVDTQIGPDGRPRVTVYAEEIPR